MVWCLFLLSIQGNILKHFTGLENMNYGLILDAGSSGTRLYIYEWDTDINCEHSPTIKPSFYKYGKKKGRQIKYKKSGGIAQVKPEDIQDYLRPFIAKALKFVPKNKYHQTPIYLKATAGMRLLDLKEAQTILDRIKKYFQSTPFLFNDNYGVQIIPGEYEGIFGWLSLNYIHKPEKKRLAALDLGGASTQITFRTPELPLENSFPVTLNGTTKVIYTHSYLQYGRNQARVRHHKDNLIIKDPCFVKGSKVKVEEDRTIIGTGEFQTCLNLTAQLTKKDICSFDSCGLNGIYQPFLPSTNDFDFYLTDGYFETADFFGCTGKTTLDCLYKKADSMCSNSNSTIYDEIKNNFISRNGEEYLDEVNELKSEADQFCFNAAYIINLLHKGYGFGYSDDIHLSQSINGVDIGWTLGAMVYEANLLYPAGQCCK